MSLSRKTALLLDFDGVIVKKNPLFPVVSQRCKRYIQRYIPIKNHEKVGDLNAQLYDTCGHTVIGLQKLGYNATIKEFNNYIYEFLDYEKLKCMSGHEYSEEANQFLNLFTFCSQNKIDPYIFSNAPPLWVHHTMYYLAPSLKDQVKIINDTCQYLKPDPLIYEKLEKTALKDYDNIVFVDDKIINILPVVDRSRWMSLLMTKSKQYNPMMDICKSKVGLVQDLDGVQYALARFT